jgi:hypothetical protein
MGRHDGSAVVAAALGGEEVMLSYEGKNAMALPGTVLKLAHGCFAKHWAKWTAIIFWLWMAATVPGAGLDPEMKAPYRLRVILMFSDSRVITALFKDQVQREVTDSFQTALGNMGQVEVLDESDLKALKEKRKGLEETWKMTLAVKERGLRGGLDEWHELSETKIHFVQVEANDEGFEIRARQFDGLIGMASPLIRTVHITDRQTVGRVVGLMINRDFGITGTIGSGGESQELWMGFRGGSLGTPLSAWVQKGDVFGIVKIRQQDSGRRADLVPWAMLQAVEPPHDGGCRCRLLHRWQNPLAEGPGVLGFRCFKLGTGQGPLQVRLFDEEKHAPLGSVRYTVSQYSFDDQNPEEGSSNADGIIRTRRNYHNVAFLQIKSGDNIRARLPVAILDDRMVVCVLRSSAKEEERGQLELKHRRLVERINETLAKQGEFYNRLKQLDNEKSRETGLQEAQNGLKSLQNDLKGFQQDAADLRESYRQLDPSQPANLDDVDQSLKNLLAAQSTLGKYTTELEDARNKEQDPKRLKIREMLARADFLQKGAQFDEAIAVYEKAVLDARDIPELKQPAEELLFRLKHEWEPKNEEHKKARKFVAEVWPGLSTASDLKAHMEEARKALQVFQTNNDKMAPLNILKVNTRHITELGKQLQSLQGSTRPEDQAETRTISEVTSGLTAFSKQVSDYLVPAPPAGGK